MKTVLGGAACVLVTAGVAVGGGIERNALTSGILFEQGTYAELTYSYVDPGVSGEQGSTLDPIFATGASTGDVAQGYSSVSLGFKTALTEDIDLALLVYQPYGASVEYSEPGYLYGTDLLEPFGFEPGSAASVTTEAVTAMLRYKLPEEWSVLGGRFSVFGGVTYEQARGDVNLFFTYTMETKTTADWGYVLGAAWERPDIAARVSLTYTSAITHDFETSETVFGASVPSNGFSTTIPQSLNLAFQTGINPKTLLFGNIRWTDWTAFEIAPDFYSNGLGLSALVDYDDDVITYNLGVGRKLTDKWSGAVTLGYEASQGGFAGNLGPTDGYFSVGLLSTYQVTDKLKLTGGARYIWIGDAKTQSPLVAGETQGDFKDNSGWALGMRIAYTF